MVCCLRKVCCVVVAGESSPARGQHIPSSNGQTVVGLGESHASCEAAI